MVIVITCKDLKFAGRIFKTFYDKCHLQESLSSYFYIQREVTFRPT